MTEEARREERHGCVRVPAPNDANTCGTPRDAMWGMGGRRANAVPARIGRAHGRAPTSSGRATSTPEGPARFQTRVRCPPHKPLRDGDPKRRRCVSTGQRPAGSAAARGISAHARLAARRDPTAARAPSGSFDGRVGRPGAGDRTRQRLRRVRPRLAPSARPHSRRTAVPRRRPRPPRALGRRHRRQFQAIAGRWRSSGPFPIPPSVQDHAGQPGQPRRRRVTETVDRLPVDPALVEEAAALDIETAAARHADLAERVSRATSPVLRLDAPELTDPSTTISSAASFALGARIRSSPPPIRRPSASAALLPGTFHRESAIGGRCCRWPTPSATTSCGPSIAESRRALQRLPPAPSEPAPDLAYVAELKIDG